MEITHTVKGTAAPYRVPNIDTDVIVRIERVVALKRGEFGPYAFEAVRYASNGLENPEFILNQTAYRCASILVAGKNFGCGSSREAAVWALWDYGVRCIIAPSFGEIFHTNCLQNGLLAIALPERRVDEIAKAIQPDANHNELEVNLEAREITLPDGRTVPFDMDGRSREALLRGLDPIEMTLCDEHEIAAFQAYDEQMRPWVYNI